MRLIARLTTPVAVAVVLTLPLAAQAPTGLIGDLLKDVGDVESKVVGLARAMPASAYEWRPGKGVRSTGEVFMHIAADNYYMPAAMGAAAPAATGITKDYQTAATFEKRTMPRDQIVAELEKSFAFLKTSMTATSDAALAAPLEAFGQKTTRRAVWISATTHLHEHLGQLIAYARSNNVTPPWSK